MTRYPDRSSEFRAYAAAEAAAGAVASLAQVRAKHERAARMWSDLAEQEDTRARERAARLAGAG